jgi:Na+/H+ antiporter NhaC
MMLTKVKLYLYGIFAAFMAFAGVYLYRKGKADAKSDHVRRRVEAMTDAKENRHEIENSDDQRLVDILSGKLRK